MGQIKNVIVIDENTLRIEEDAHKGDTINLKELQKVDVSFIQNLIQEERDRVYNEKLASEKANWEAIKKQEELLSKATFEKQLEEARAKKNEELATLEKEKQNEIQKLKDQLKDNLSKNQADLLDKERAHSEEISKLRSELEILKANKAVEIEAEKSKKDAQYQIKISELTQQIQSFEQAKKDAVELASMKKENEFKDKLNILEKERHEAETAWTEKNNELKKELEDLRLQKSINNVKMLGENLEQWCDKEFKNYQLAGFNNCTWEKDNTLVKDENDAASSSGTKADFIFRVYSTEEHTPENEIASVCLDMKDENPNSSHRKKNADYFKKLHEDRVKKNCNYALLVSQLERSESNDTPIQRVSDYPDMYVVRPQYFIAFLSLITSLAKKYELLLNGKKKEELDLKEKKDIMDEFNKLKVTYFEKPLNTMENQLADIRKGSEAIETANNKIKEATDKLINESIAKMRNKIDTFEINTTRLAKKIDKIKANQDNE